MLNKTKYSIWIITELVMSSTNRFLKLISVSAIYLFTYCTSVEWSSFCLSARKNVKNISKENPILRLWEDMNVCLFVFFLKQVDFLRNRHIFVIETERQKKWLDKIDCYWKYFLNKLIISFIDTEVVWFRMKSSRQFRVQVIRLMLSQVMIWNSGAYRENITLWAAAKLCV